MKYEDLEVGKIVRLRETRDYGVISKCCLNEVTVYWFTWTDGWTGKHYETFRGHYIDGLVIV